MRALVTGLSLLASLVLVSCGDAPATPRGLSVASLNVLLGAFCEPGSDGCRQEERIDLLFAWIAARGCPDVVTLQEVTPDIRQGVERRLAGADCDFVYQIFPSPFGAQMTLSRYDVIDSEQVRLFGGIRSVLHARIDHPIGPLDVFTTHLAASIDGGPEPCGDGCPDECVAAGGTINRDCQAVEVARLVEERHVTSTPAVVTGDFNSRPSTFVYGFLAARGWIDVYLAAGNPECDPQSGVGCTSGRDDETLADLESPELGVAARIDYVFLVPPQGRAACDPRIDSPADDDGDGVATRLFADEPNPFGPACGPRPQPICWPSDHIGVQLDLACA